MDLKSFKTRNSSTQSVGSDYSSPDSLASRMRTSDRGRKLSKLIKRRRGSTQTDDADGERPKSRREGDTRDGEEEQDVSILLNQDPALSSLITSGSDEESSPNTTKRPSLSNHQSHIGFLTLSSPLIPTEPIGDSKPPPTGPSSTVTIPTLTKSETLGAPPSTSRRSPSPVGKLKGAFNPTRRSSKSAVGTSADSAKLVGAGGGGSSSGGIANIFSSKSRRGSNSSRPPKLLEDQPTFQEPGQSTPSPERTRRRSIVTPTPATPPNLLDGPATFITPPTPTDSRSESEDLPLGESTGHRRTSSTPDTDVPATGGSSTHRRSKSALAPSKLSQSVVPPLTPAAEEERTPSGTVVAGTSSGFFSSVFSAAQNAANSLSNSITSTNSGQKNKGGPEASGTGQAGVEEVILSNSTLERSLNSIASQKRKPAVDTLGSGNLSLSHLGISEEDISPMSSRANLAEGVMSANQTADEAAAKKEDTAAAKAVSKAYSETLNGEKTSTVTDGGRSATDVTNGNTTVRRAAEPDNGSIKRASSVRSKLSGGRRRRTRGSSGNTSSGMTLAPGITSRSTGFAVANVKRNREFHNTFKSVPEDDYLIEDYAAALQRDILLQGRLYISEGHVCFWSNIFGYVTTLVMSFDEVISVEKKSTAMIFQNGIVIQTLHARNSFASLLNRDTTYELIINIWKISHPNLRSSLNGNPVDGAGTGDKTEKAASIAEDDSASEEIYDEDLEDDDDDDDDDGDTSFVEAREGSIAGSDIAENIKSADRKTSAMVASGLGGAAPPGQSTEAAVTGTAVTADFPGPTTHVPTECGDQASHCEKLLIDATIPAPLGKIYSLMFGPASGTFMRKWLLEDQKLQDLQLEDDKKGLGPDRKTLNFSYIKPLGGSVGPKQTKCLISETLEQFDLEKVVTVACSTQNPDVPSGNLFVVKTRYCLMWAPGNATRLLMTCAIEWSGKSWFKGPIEKGANDGQMQYAKDIVAALKGAVTKSPVSKNGTKGKGKAGRRKKESDVSDMQDRNKTDLGSTAASGQPSWGIFEPVHEVVGPIVDIIGAIVSPTIFFGFLGVLVLFLFWRRGATAGARPYNLGVPGIPTHQRMAAYEEMWRGEESELWRWLEERIGMENMGAMGKHKDMPAKSITSRGVKAIRDLDSLGKREILEAIRVTRERLEALEGAVHSKQRKQSTPGLQKSAPPEGEGQKPWEKEAPPDYTA